MKGKNKITSNFKMNCSNRMVGVVLLLVAVFAKGSMSLCPHGRESSHDQTQSTVRSSRIDCTGIDRTYRPMDGECTNKDIPLSGSRLQPFRRLRPHFYGPNDTIRTLSFNSSTPFPNERYLSTAFSNAFVPPEASPITTVWIMQWGQFMTHEIIETPINLTVHRGCCPNGIEDNSNGVCEVMDVSKDSFYASYNQICFRFTRSMPVAGSNPREQFNNVTAFVDASVMYGSDSVKAGRLRTMMDGKMMVDDEFELTQPAPVWNFLNTSKTPFAGDIRTAMTPGHIACTTMFVHMHNDWADRIVKSNKNLDGKDELIFQEVRRLMSAVFQKITFKDYIPIVIGQDLYDDLKFKLPNSRRGYNKTIDATLHNSVGIAFRFGHSSVPSHAIGHYHHNAIWPEMFKLSATRDEEMYPSWLLANQAKTKALAIDGTFSDFMRNKMFALPTDNFKFGEDILAINTKRGRELGLASLNDYREHCGFPRITDFVDLLNEVHNQEYVDILEELYPNVDDIELFIGGISEKLLPGALVGKTFACIIGNTFINLVYGDPYYYEFKKDNPKPFSQDQLDSIEATSMATLLCYYNKRLDKVQRNVFLYPTEGGGSNDVDDCSTILANSIDVASTLELDRWDVDNHNHNDHNHG